MLSQAGTPQPQRRRRRHCSSKISQTRWASHVGHSETEPEDATDEPRVDRCSARASISSHSAKQGRTRRSIEHFGDIVAYRSLTGYTHTLRTNRILGSDRPQLRAYNVRYTDQVWTFVKNRSVVTCRDNRPDGLSPSPRRAILRGGLGRFRSRPLLLIGTEVATSATDAVDWPD